MARILVVDDSATQILTVTRMLKKHGHDTVTASNGEQGIELARQELPDLILMDVVMPKLNGFQATRRMTHDGNIGHIPVILMTTKDQQTDKIWGIRQGARDYIVKPFTEEVLMAAVDKYLPAANAQSR